MDCLDTNHFSSGDNARTLRQIDSSQCTLVVYEVVAAVRLVESVWFRSLDLVLINILLIVTSAILLIILTFLQVSYYFWSSLNILVLVIIVLLNLRNSTTFLVILNAWLFLLLGRCSTSNLVCGVCVSASRRHWLFNNARRILMTLHRG